MAVRSSRIWQFLVMLPFFLLGVALPVYFFGFSGDGPPNLTPERYSPLTRGDQPSAAPAPAPAPKPGPAAGEPADDTRPWDYPAGDTWEKPAAPVGFMRGLFEGVVDRTISENLSPGTIKLATFGGIVVLAYLLIRLVLALLRGTVGSMVGFLVHKAAAPMFMGFLAVGSTWGIHQTIAEEFGMNWAATTVTITAAVAALFSLAGVKIR